MTIYNICTECPERCVLTSKDTSCSKWKDRLWINRGEILCRFCKDVETNCLQCAKDKCRIGYGMQSDNFISENIFNDFKARKEGRK